MSDVPATRKTALLVVYFMEDKDIDVLDLHLAAVRRHTADQDYTILAVANRVSPFIRARLAKEPRLELVDIPAVEVTGSEEHSHYLDALSRHAVAQGYSHIVTYDCDAFPVRDGWLAELLDMLDAETPVVAVFRAENGDTWLPHPLMTCFSTAFYRQHAFSFFPDAATQASPEFRGFIQQTRQIVDSGIGLGYYLHRAGIKWRRLLRSNRVNDHYLLAGIYHDLVFHLGSMSRAAKIYRLDRLRDWRIRAVSLFRYYVYDPPKDSWVRRLTDLVEQPALASLARRNARTYAQIRDALTRDAEAYIRRLRGV
ncbi:MAG: hypothetical protein AB1831_09695 [Pseudomonadota bacterium]